MFFKLCVCLSVLFLVEAESFKEVLPKLKTFHNDFFDRQIEQDPNLVVDVDGSAVVLKSNLPIAIQSRLAGILTAIYQQTPDKLQRAQQFQTNLATVYNVYWNVIINFDVITFYSQYYILLQINGDRVLGFGLA